VLDELPQALLSGVCCRCLHGAPPLGNTHDLWAETGVVVTVSQGRAVRADSIKPSHGAGKRR
jgi:hypothetical protein